MTDSLTYLKSDHFIYNVQIIFPIVLAVKRNGQCLGMKHTSKLMLMDCLLRCILVTRFRLSSQVVTDDKILENVSLAEINTAHHFYLSIYKLSFGEIFDFGAAISRSLARFYILLHKI